MTTYNKKYSVGSISLAEPYFDYVHTLPLVTFSDIKSAVELALVYNSQIATNNYFNIADGYKFNLQKKIVETSTGLSLLDSNGLMIKCNPATNQTASSATVYALNDDSHRILRRITSGFELEYPDYSKEYFNSDGKQTSSFDKYGEEIFRFEYESSGELKSIAYRPEVGADYKKFEFSYSSGRLVTVKYSANEELFIIGTFSLTNNGFDIQHYSDVKYHFRKAGNEYIAYSTITNANGGQTTVHRVDCTKTGNTYVVNTLEYGVTKDTITYDAFLLGENNEIKMLDITNFYDIKTRMHYNNHRLHYSYEVLDDSAMFINGDIYAGNVNIQEKNGLSGTISFQTGYKMSYSATLAGRVWYYEFDMDEDPTTYTAKANITGWVKGTESKTIGVLVNGYKTVSLDISDDWRLFTLPIDNTEAYVSVVFDNANTLYMKDFRLVFKDEGVTRNRALYGVIDLTDSFFAETLANSDEIDEEKKYRATSTDILRYLWNVRNNHHTNEFYYNDGRNVLIKSGGLYLYDKDGNGIGFTTGISLKKECAKKNETLCEKYTMLSPPNFLQVERYSEGSVYRATIQYNGYMDVVKETENADGTGNNNVVKTISYNTNHQIVSETVGDITHTYAYDDNNLSTKLVSETDEFNTVTTYTTDPVWGVVTKAVVGTLAEAENTYTNDGADLTVAKFGGGITQNDIGYTNGLVTSMSSGGVSYGFAYSNNDLTSVTKNNMLLKSFSYADDYKTVTATTPTSSSASFVTKKTTDKYGRTTGLYKTTTATEPDLIINKYGIEYTNENDEKHYANNGSAPLYQWTDKTTGATTTIGYEHNRRGGEETVSSADTKLHAQTYLYDDAGRVTAQDFKYGTHDGSDYSNRAYSHIEYETGATGWGVDNRVRAFRYTVNERSPVTSRNYFDNLKRPIKKSNFVEDIVFRKEIGYTKSRVTSVADFVETETTTTATSNTAYSYDALGRIVGETDSEAGTSKSYVYDMAGRLVRENNSALNETYAYEYDSVGNVTSKNTHAYTTASTPGTATATTAFSYDSTHPDRLTSFGGKAITYDQQGCPLTYDGKTYTWTRGKLTKYTISGLTLNPGAMERAIIPPTTAIENWTYTYNGNGQRTQKKYTYIPPSSAIIGDYVSSKTVDYTYDHSGRLVKERTKTVSKNSGTTTSSIVYLYDDSGIIGMVKDGAGYYFHRNIQGDVVGVYNSAGTKVVGFTYDAFGRCTVSGNTTLAQWCKIRYRGYYFDAETGFYWVQTRYYNPEWCRWISPDTLDYLDSETAHGLNLYAYCGNDPVNFTDPSGHLFISFLLISMSVAAAFGGAAAGITAYRSGERGLDLFADVVGGMIFGAAVGATIALGGASGLAATGATIAGFGLSTGAALGISIGATAVAGMARYSLDCVDSKENRWNVGGFFLSGVEGALQGAATFGLAYVGGRAGAFNSQSKLQTNVSNVPLSTNSHVNTYIRLIGDFAKKGFGELSKIVFVSIPAAVVRYIISELL
ncbi:MAG: hypothetical protein IJY49_06175 [Clostridia bacterium]|nr:hypothetical protein [Clostridia bacterium]